MKSKDQMTKEERVEYWEMVISEFKESGQTKSEYCGNNDIPVSTFNYWEKRLGELRESEDSGRFVELKLSAGDLQEASLVEAGGVFIPELGVDFGGLRILVNSETPMNLLTKVLGEVGYA